MVLQLIRRVLIGGQLVDHKVDTVNLTSAGVSEVTCPVCENPTFFSAFLSTFFFSISHIVLYHHPITHKEETPLLFL